MGAISSKRLGALALSVCAVLVACGGSGGGPSESDGTTGLVPAAPPPGDLLRQDATVLRPLRVGSVWQYRGNDRESALHVPRAFDTRVAHEAQAGGVVETSSDSLGLGADRISVTKVGNDVVRTEAFALTPEMPLEALVTTELRSPLRVNDQYPGFDRRIADAVQDIDRDGRKETLDIAAYRRVIGEETLELRALGTRRVVRVDLVIHARVRLSSGEVGPVATARDSFWYLENVGVVKREFRGPETDGVGRIVVEELAYWDAQSEGIGIVPAKRLQIPAGRPDLSGTDGGRPLAVVKVGDELGIVTVNAEANEVTILHADASGLVRSATHHKDAEFAGPVQQLGHWTSDGRQMLLVRYREEPGPLSGWNLVRIGADGQPLGSLQGVPLELPAPGTPGGNVQPRAVAAASGKFWMLYFSYADEVAEPVPAARLLLRAFAADGRALTPEILVDEANPGSNVDRERMRIAANSAGVLVTWKRLKANQVVDDMQAWLPASSETPIKRVISTSSGSSSEIDFRPAVVGARGILGWMVAFDSTRLLRLNEEGAPLLSPGATSVNDEVARDSRLDCEIVGLWTVLGDDQGGLARFGGQCRLWPEDLFSQSVPSAWFTFLDNSATSIAPGIGTARRLSSRADFIEGQRFEILFPDRLVVFGQTRSQDALALATVWRR